MKIRDDMKRGITKEQFEIWKKFWFERIPKCKDFVCCHEMTSCAINFLCGCGSIYETYSKQKHPRECTTVGCADCMLKYECEKLK